MASSRQDQLSIPLHVYLLPNGLYHGILWYFVEMIATSRTWHDYIY